MHAAASNQALGVHIGLVTSMFPFPYVERSANEALHLPVSAPVSTDECDVLFEAWES